MAAFTESVVEEAAFGWLAEMDYVVLQGAEDRQQRCSLPKG